MRQYLVTDFCIKLTRDLFKPDTFVNLVFQLFAEIAFWYYKH